MTDVTTLSDADAGALAAGYVYLWVPGTPAAQYKVALTDLVTLGLATARWKEPVRVATTAAGTLASSFENGDTVDGVVLATGDRILIKNQVAAAENGFYTVNASGAPSRTTDADTGAELVNAAVFVAEGTANADKLFVCTTNATIVLGTTALSFASFGGGTEASAAEIWAAVETSKFVSPDKLFAAAEFQTLTDGATITPDFDAGINFTVTLGGNRTLANPTNAKDGQSGVIEVVQDATGSRTLAFGANWRFPGGAASGGVLSTAANSIDVIAYVVKGSLIYATLSKAFAA